MSGDYDKRSIKHTNSHNSFKNIKERAFDILKNAAAEKKSLKELYQLTQLYNNFLIEKCDQIYNSDAYSIENQSVYISANMDSNDINNEQHISTITIHSSDEDDDIYTTATEPDTQ